jgi:purine-binding chemotaxis protein CheW
LFPSPLQRALQRAPVRAAPAQARPEREFLAFEVGGLALAVASDASREVIRAGPLTPLPRVPAFVLGVCAHRGEVLPVLDLLRLLGRGEVKPQARSRLVVGTAGAYTAALLVDAVVGLHRIALEEIQPAPAGTASATDALIGIVERDGEALHLLDFPQLMSAARHQAVAR